MSIYYRIDHEARLVIAVATGTLTDEDVFGYQREVWSSKDVLGHNELVDTTHVTSFAVRSAERIRDLATLAAQNDDPLLASKFAIVAPGTLAFELGRIFQAYRQWDRRSTKQVEVFRTMDEALQFLGLEHSPEFPTLG